MRRVPLAAPAVCLACAAGEDRIEFKPHAGFATVAIVRWDRTERWTFGGHRRAARAGGSKSSFLEADMASRTSHKGKSHTAGKDITDFAKAFFERVRDIKASHPDLARDIDACEKSIRERLMEIRDHIHLLPGKQEKDLVTFLVIQGVTKMAEEVLAG